MSKHPKSQTCFCPECVGEPKPQHAWLLGTCIHCGYRGPNEPAECKPAAPATMRDEEGDWT